GAARSRAGAGLAAGGVPDSCRTTVRPPLGAPQAGLPLTCPCPCPCLWLWLSASKDPTASPNFRRPGGRRTWMCAVFRRGQDALSKNPFINEQPGVLWAQSVFFGSVSLTLIKEMNSAAQRAKRSCSCLLIPCQKVKNKSNAFA